ncbi:MAG TPA: hypothetical protein VHF23_10745 [Gaiellaceae bacterium]|nr:hypothetical protein [Gaiellaceae bacterium]
MVPAAPAGVCFGYEPRTAVALRYLRSGSADPLSIEEARDPDPRSLGRPLREWRPPGNPLHARLYRDGTCFRLWIEGGGWFGIEPERPAILVPEGADPLRREERLWGIPSLLCFVRRGEVPLHGAAVEVDGGALVLCGPSRAGKTTLAAAFLRAGHRVLAEDLSCCRLGPAPAPAILPGPAMLRIRWDVYRRLEVPGAVVGEDDDRVHLAHDGELRGDGGPVPLRGIVLLRRGGRIGLERVPAQEALRDLWALSLKLPEDTDRARCFHGLVELTAGVPVWNLHRPLSYGRLPTVVRTLARLCASS